MEKDYTLDRLELGGEEDGGEGRERLEEEELRLVSTMVERERERERVEGLLR